MLPESEWEKKKERREKKNEKKIWKGGGEKKKIKWEDIFVVCFGFSFDQSWSLENCWLSVFLSSKSILFSFPMSFFSPHPGILVFWRILCPISKLFCLIYWYRLKDVDIFLTQCLLSYHYWIYLTIPAGENIFSYPVYRFTSGDKRMDLFPQLLLFTILAS